jgi:hypothetical protein
MRKCWHYLYVILYPALGYKFYYGSRITDRHPDQDNRYFGSSVSYRQYNDHGHPEYQADALKVILHATCRARTKKAERELSAAEAELIRAALETLGFDVCLNRNISGRFCLSPEQQQRAWQNSRARGSGFSGMSQKDRQHWAAEGGKRSRELKAGIHAIPKEQLDKSRLRGCKTVSARYAKTYEFRDPNGQHVVICNLNQFCRKNGLQASHMRGLLAGRGKSHKGWTRPW